MPLGDYLIVKGYGGELCKIIIQLGLILGLTR